MVQYQEANSAAATLLIHHVSPLLMRYFASQYGCAADVHDLLQNTWLQIHRSRHTYRPGEPVLPWIFAIARHVKTDAFRHARRIRAREQAVSRLPEPRLSPGPSSGSAPDFNSLIAVLPESQREVIRLLKGSGMSLNEVARATASSVGSVKLKAHRAYETLRSVLQRYKQTELAGSDDDVV